MSEITLSAIEELLDQVLDKKLEPIKTVLKNHTSVLSQIAAEKQSKDDSEAVNAARFERIEQWGQKVGNQIGIKLEL